MTFDIKVLLRATNESIMNDPSKIFSHLKL